MGDQIDDEGETSKEGYKGDVNEERYSGSERREQRSDHTREKCVIRCGKIPFWNLVVRAVALRVTGLWGEREVWRSQSGRW